VAASETKMKNAPAESNVGLKNSAAPMQRQAKDSPAEKVAGPVSENYFFRVSGTNRSLQQQVVFTGNYQSFSNAAQSSSQSFSRFGGGGGGGNIGNISQVTDKNLYQQSLFSNSRIAGTALVNSTNEIEINALPITP